ncbi:MAG: PLP-dependent aminotransferase family protein [Planctomycetota bacterium]
MQTSPDSKPTPRGEPDTLVGRIATDLRQQIERGDLGPGDRLPTLRATALAHGVHPSTAQQAYRQLQGEGLVSSQVGRGTVVLEPEVAQPQSTPQRPRGKFSPAARAALAAVDNARGWSLPNLADCEFDFLSLHPEPSLFPADELKAAIDSALDPSRTALGYGDPAGSPRLRQLLAERGGRRTEEVLVTSGAQQGIDLVVRALVAPGEAVAVAVPTYPQLFGLLATQGVRAVPIESEDGIADPESLREVTRRDDVRLVYVMPSFHNPTGHTLDLDERKRFFDVLADTEVPVLEDEYESDLRFRGEAPPTLASLDPRGRTVTVRTVSKALFPGLRLGWLEANADLLSPMLALKQFSDIETSGFLQEVLLLLLERGALDEHLDRLREDLRRRHDLADRMLTDRLGEQLRWQSPEGGPMLWIRCDGLDAEQIARRASEKGVAVLPNRVFDPEGLRPNAPSAIRLSVARTTDDRLERGLQILCDCLESELEESQRKRAARPVIF